MASVYVLSYDTGLAALTVPVNWIGHRRIYASREGLQLGLIGQVGLPGEWTSDRRPRRGP